MVTLVVEDEPLLQELSPDIRTIFRLSGDIRYYDNIISGIMRRNDSPKDEVYSALVPIVDTWHEMSVTLDSRFNPSGANVPSLAEYSELHAMALAAKRLFERLVDKIQHATDVYWAKLTPSTTRLWRNSRLDQLIDICQRILDIFRGKRSHYLLTKSYRNAAWTYINRDTARVSISDNRLYLHNHKRCHPFFSTN